MRTNGWTFKDTESRTSHPVTSDRVGLPWTAGPNSASHAPEEFPGIIGKGKTL